VTGDGGGNGPVGWDVLPGPPADGEDGERGGQGERERDLLPAALGVAPAPRGLGVTREADARRADLREQARRHRTVGDGE